MWVDEAGKPYQGGGVIIGNKRYWFPTDEQFIKAGYHWYIPPAPEPPDMTDFNNACVQFRAVCAQIEQAADLPGFKGGFDDMVKFQQSAVFSTLQGMQLATAWNAADKLCTYEASKIGIGQPDWWYKCWEDASLTEESVEPEDNGEETIAD